MIEIGKKQKLIVAKTVEFGVYLAKIKMPDRRTECFFPANVPQGTKEGDTLEVFIYKDSRPPYATTREPLFAGRSDCCS